MAKVEGVDFGTEEDWTDEVRRLVGRFESLEKEGDERGLARVLPKLFRACDMRDGFKKLRIGA